MFSSTGRRGFIHGTDIFIPITVFTLFLAFFGLFNTHRVFSDEPSFFPGETISDSELALFEELEKSADEISVRELNECHLAMIGRMISSSDINLQLKLQYGGIVKDQGTAVITSEKYPRLIIKRSHIEGSIGNPLGWMVIDKNGIGIFSMSMTVRKTDMTVAELPLKKRTLYVNIFGAEKENREELTKKRDDLGGVSILEFVKRLEKGSSELETPEAN